MSFMHLIIRGKWKTPCHSSNRGFDDTHEVKNKILNQVKDTIKEIGKNPDLDINPKTKKIVLKGRGNYSNKEIETDLNAEDYFVELYISYIQPSNIMYAKNYKLTNYYIVPNDPLVLDSLIDFIFNKFNHQHFIIEIRI